MTGKKFVATKMKKWWRGVNVLKFGCLIVPLYSQPANPDWVITGIKSRGRVGRWMSATTTAVRRSVHMRSLERQNEVSLLLTCLKLF